MDFHRCYVESRLSVKAHGRGNPKNNGSRCHKMVPRLVLIIDEGGLVPNDDDPNSAHSLPHEAEVASAGTVDRLAEFNRYRGLLFSIAYRMLGSVSDAEDILQEAFIRWQRASETDVRTTRAFLVTVVSRLCINHLQSARVRREEYVGQWLPEPIVTGPTADPFTISQVDESLSMAFLVLLERLSPVERAVFLLREVFEYEYSEIARTVGKDEANCRQILRRAHQHMAEVRPRFKASARQQEQLLGQFRQAATTGDLAGLVALLSREAVLHSDGGGKAPAVPNLVFGRDDVAKAIVGGLKKLVPANLSYRMAQVNGEPGIVSYLEGRAFSVLTLDVADGVIQAIYIVTNPAKLAHLAPLPAPPC
jgi:RNA polymerase sigma-70 factor (ECF subfamily)